MYFFLGYKNLIIAEYTSINVRISWLAAASTNIIAISMTFSSLGESKFELLKFVLILTHRNSNIYRERETHKGLTRMG